MSVEGYFHDAHEVFAVDGDIVLWVARFRTEVLAVQYVKYMTVHESTPARYEVVPV